jgi:uncharacterized protein (TIGR03067 family)
MRTLTLLTFAALALAFAPAPLPKPQRGPDPDKADLTRLQGTWQLTRHINRDREQSVTGWQLRIAGSSATFQDQGRDGTAYWLTLNAKTNPKTMTWTYKEWQVEHRATYTLNGNTLKIRVADREFMEVRRVRP